MPINRNLKLLLVHIPKCAGSSAAKLIGASAGQGDRHVLNEEILYGVNENGFVLQTMPYYSYFNYINPQEFIKFSITRNPYDRFLSDYYWSGRRPQLYEHYKNPVEALKEIKNTLENQIWGDLLVYDHMHFNHFLPQYHYLLNLEGVIEKEITLIKLENLSEGITFVEKLVGNKMPHINAGPVLNKNFKEELPSEAIELINEIYYIDFKYLGYEML